jgi:hypothetical protein
MNDKEISQNKTTMLHKPKLFFGIISKTCFVELAEISEILKMHSVLKGLTDLSRW